MQREKSRVNDTLRCKNRVNGTPNPVALGNVCISFFCREIYMYYNEGTTGGIIMWKDKLKAYWNENPVACIAVGAFAATAAAKLIDALSAAQGRRAYARQVDYRVATKQ